LEEELEATLNFPRTTITSTSKLVPQIIVISNSKEEVEVGPQPIVQEQPQLVLTSKIVEDKRLQLVNNGNVFFQKLFEKGLIFSIIPQCPRSRTRTMMKWKGKVHLKKHVEKLVKKNSVSKAKESQKMLQWMKMASNKLKWVR
jgi:hypothetical protein